MIRFMYLCTGSGETEEKTSARSARSSDAELVAGAPPTAPRASKLPSSPVKGDEITVNWLDFQGFIKEIEQFPQFQGP